MNGILLINKPKDVTSRDVVNKISKILHTKKVGHTGTLDPLATGVLVVCVGSATKLTEILTASEKEYIALVTLGIHTDTLDITGNVLEEQDTNHIHKIDIERALKKLIGTYEQEVPIYSAIKVNGKKLYEYARNNEEIKLPKKSVTIKELSLLGDVQYESGKTSFQIRCLVSKGTYIRSLVRDIAKELNTIGVMSELNRIKQGIFSLEQCQTLEDLENEVNLIPLHEVLKEYPQVKIDKTKEQEIKNGKILNNIYQEDNIVFINQNNQVLALYHTYEKDKTKIKPWKMF